MIEYFIESGYEVTNKRLIPSLIRLSSMMRLDPPTNTIALLIKGGLISDECFDDNFRTPLHLACKYGVSDIIRYFFIRIQIISGEWMWFKCCR